MTADEPFRRTIWERPDDDAPRLVYADWLEEHDDPERAEFIRLQCRLENQAADAPERPALVKRDRVRDKRPASVSRHLRNAAAG